MSAQSILLIKKQYILRINTVFKTLSLYALCFCLYGVVQVLYNAFGWVGAGGDLLLFVTRVGGYFRDLLDNKLK